LPNYVAQQNASVVSSSSTVDAPNPSAFAGEFVKNGVYGEPQSRKRPYNDRSEDGGSGEMQGDRHMKQMRRGNGRNGRADAVGVRNGRGGFHLAGSSAAAQTTALSFADLPISPPGLPFDPSDPLAAMMAMQAMALPGFAGMAPLPQAMSPTGFGQFGVQPLQLPSIMSNTQMKQRCRDYDNKGYCTRGNSCPFEHGNDLMIVAGQDGK
jgi:RNA-binding protein 26